MKRYRKLVSLLKKRLPLAYPVEVRRVKLSQDTDGICFKYNKKFFIRISKLLKEDMAMEVLIHEWAHARSWNHLHDKMDEKTFIDTSHDSTWGVNYAEVYNVFEKEFLND